MAFTYDRTIRFQDTDAAGVVYFATLLAICHEAYEASLAASEINLREFFGHPEVAIPITHASIDFFRPLFCGDRTTISLVPSSTSETEFEVHYHLFLTDRPEKHVGKAITRHVCISQNNRSRVTLPITILQWLNRWEPQEPAATPMNPKTYPDRP